MGKKTIGYGTAAAIAILFNSVLMYAKETNATVLAAMKTVPPFYHHWATHGILVMLVFLILGWLLSNTSFANRRSAWVTTVIVTSTVIAGLGIVAFYGNEVLRG